MDDQNIATALKLATERKLKSNDEQALITLSEEMAILREEMAIERELRYNAERQLASERELRYNAERQRNQELIVNLNRRNQELEAIVNQQNGKPVIVTSITLKEYFSYILHTYFSL